MRRSTARAFASNFAARAGSRTASICTTRGSRASSRNAAICRVTSCSSTSTTPDGGRRSGRPTSMRICARSPATHSRPRIFAPGPARCSPRGRYRKCPRAGSEREAKRQIVRAVESRRETAGQHQGRLPQELYPSGRPRRLHERRTDRHAEVAPGPARSPARRARARGAGRRRDDPPEAAAGEAASQPFAPSPAVSVFTWCRAGLRARAL